MKEKNEKKKMNGFVKFLIVIACIILVIGCAIMIILPDLFSPRDLGVKSTEKSYVSAIEKLGFERNDVPNSGTYDDYNHTFGPVVEVNDLFSSEEFTSFLNFDKPSYYAIKNMQVKIDKDNTMSFSASVAINSVLKAVDGLPEKYHDKDNLPVSFVIPNNVNIYATGHAAIENNRIAQFDVEGFEVAGYDSKEIMEGYDGFDVLVEEIDDQLNYLSELTGSYFDTIKPEDGQLRLVGKIPSYHKYEKK